MTPWRYLPDQHCYSALHGQHYLRLQKRDGVWQWFAERLEPDGCAIISGSSETRPEAQAAAIDAADRSGGQMSNFKDVTDDRQQREGEERYLRIIDDRCWISVLYRLTGFGYWEWETAIVFVADVPQPTHKDRELLIIRGDWRQELNDMPKEQLRDWYAARIDGNRNSWDTLMAAIENAAEFGAADKSGDA